MTISTESFGWFAWLMALNVVFVVFVLAKLEEIVELLREIAPHWIVITFVAVWFVLLWLLPDPYSAEMRWFICAGAAGGCQ
jgi:uncharacterized membrane protein YbhN (UPF0104 family)